jgi:hypothetical protein
MKTRSAVLIFGIFLIALATFTHVARPQETPHRWASEWLPKVDSLRSSYYELPLHVIFSCHKADPAPKDTRTEQEKRADEKLGIAFFNLDHHHQYADVTVDICLVHGETRIINSQLESEDYRCPGGK